MAKKTGYVHPWSKPCPLLTYHHTRSRKRLRTSPLVPTAPHLDQIVSTTRPAWPTTLLDGPMSVPGGGKNVTNWPTFR